MKNTQTFNTQEGIAQIRTLYHMFMASERINDRDGMAIAYNKLAESCNMFPPCNVVSSLRNDIVNYHIKNILPDVKVIETSRDKIKY